MNYSDNEIAFFNQVLLEYDMRIDGRDKMDIRDYDIIYDVINSTQSSVNLKYNNGKNEMIIAIKGEIVPLESISQKEIITLNVDEMKSSALSDNTKIKNKIEQLLISMIINRTSTESLKIKNSVPTLTWKIYIDIFIFDELRLSLMQLLSIGIRECIMKLRLPKIRTFFNEVTSANEYDLESKYTDLSMKDSEYEPKIVPPMIYVFGVINNKLYLDVNDEEFQISNSVIFIATSEKEIIHVESLGNSVNPLMLIELKNVIKNKK